jgi:hypothetical protein
MIIHSAYPLHTHPIIMEPTSDIAPKLVPPPPAPSLGVYAYSGAANRVHMPGSRRRPISPPASSSPGRMPRQPAAPNPPKQSRQQEDRGGRADPLHGQYKGALGHHPGPPEPLAGPGLEGALSALLLLDGLP